MSIHSETADQANLLPDPDICGFSTEHVFNITRAIAGRVGYQAVIDAVSDEIQAILPHNHFDVVILDKDKEYLIAYETGMTTDWGSGDRENVSTSPIRDILLEKTDYLVTGNALEDPRFNSEGMFNSPIHKNGFRSRAHVQVRVAGELIGALSLSSVKEGIYTPKHVENVKLLSDLIGPYFYALRQSELVRLTEIKRVKEAARLEGLRTGARYLTEELERARAQIGMDLHDQTLGDLSRILRRVSSSEQLSGRSLEQVTNDLSSCLLELRRIVDDAKPTVLEMFGLCDAVQAQLDRQISSTDMDVKPTLNDETDGKIDALPMELRVVFYRILQEAGNNALRHSDCNRIWVSFEGDMEDLKIRFRDDGRGFGDNAMTSRGGLYNIKIRASLVGAEVTFSDPGQPAEVQIRYQANQLQT